MATAPKSFMDLDFALTYEASAERLTGPISREALAMVGNIGPGVHLLDVAAGTGALSIPAAEMGANVLATDIAPGMVERLRQRLKPYPKCNARVADGEHLDLPDGEFDAAFSIFGGSILFSDWRKGLFELARVVKQGGFGCVSTWSQPPGGGPFILMEQALRAVFPDKPSPPIREGMRLLSKPDNLEVEMHSAGFSNVTVRAVNYTWRSAAGEGFIADTNDLYSYIQPYAELQETDRERVRLKLLELVEQYTTNGRIELPSPALIAVGQKP
jgi:ubiquinone/menaquinone biosynthesis C-methylase UbiE